MFERPKELSPESATHSSHIPKHRSLEQLVRDTHALLTEEGFEDDLLPDELIAELEADIRNLHVPGGVREVKTLEEIEAEIARLIND